MSAIQITQTIANVALAAAVKITDYTPAIHTCLKHATEAVNNGDLEIATFQLQRAIRFVRG